MLPKLPYGDQIRKAQTVAFSGINRNPAAPDGSVYWTQNMGADRMPCLSPRKPRWFIGEFDDCKGVFAYNGLYMVRGTTIYKDGVEVGEAKNDSEKEFVHYNDAVTNEDYVIMFPDKVMIRDSAPEPKQWKKGQYIVDVEANFFRDPDMRYCIIEFPDINLRELGLEAGDEITLSGSDYTANNKTVKIERIGIHQMQFRPDLLHDAREQTITIFKENVEPLEFDNVKVDVASGYNETMGTDATEFYVYSDHVDFRAMGLKAGDSVTITSSKVPGNNKTATLIHAGHRHLAFPYGTFATVMADNVTITKNNPAPVSGLVTDMEVSVENVQVVFQDGTIFGETAECNTIKRTDGVWETTGLKVGDAITISGSAEEKNNSVFVIREMSGQYLRFDENAFENTPQEGGAPEETEQISMKKEVPDLDGIFTNEQRLWGWKGSMIYCSKLNDPTNFNVFDQLADDSWTYPMDGSGDIIGGIVYQGYPMFFKQDKVVRVYGDRPSQFRVMDVSTMGLHPGCGKSLAIAGDTLLYVSRNGVTAYRGGYGENMHDSFGDLHFSEAVAATDGRRYFLSAYDGEAWSIWVYDTNWNAWFREDAQHIIHSAYDRGNLYFIFENLQGHRFMWLDGHAVDVPETAMKENFYSEVEFGDFTGNYWTAGRGYGNPSRKGTSKIQLRVTLKNAALTVWISFDGGERRKVKSIQSEGKRSYYLPIIPKRSDHYRIYLEGAGDWTLNSLVREEYSGSDIH